MATNALPPSSFIKEPSGNSYAIWSHAQLLTRLTEQLHKFLTPPTIEHCVVANLRNQELVIGADSPAWVARIRYLTPNILEHFAAQTSPVIRRVVVRSLPQSKSPGTPPQSLNKLSQTSAKLLKHTALAITDLKLQKSLLKLAARAR